MVFRTVCMLCSHFDAAYCLSHLDLELPASCLASLEVVSLNRASFLQKGCCQQESHFGVKEYPCAALTPHVLHALLSWFGISTFSAGIQSAGYAKSSAKNFSLPGDFECHLGLPFSGFWYVGCSGKEHGRFSLSLALNFGLSCRILSSLSISAASSPRRELHKLYCEQVFYLSVWFLAR